MMTGATRSPCDHRGHAGREERGGPRQIADDELERGAQGEREHANWGALARWRIEGPLSAPC